MTDLQPEWEDILESHGLPADRGNTVLDRAIYFGNPRAFTDKKSEYSTFMDSVEAEQPWWLEPSGWAVPIRVVTPEELEALDPGGCTLTYFVDLRRKHRRDKWRPELQAARFCGRHHSEETRRRIGEANRKTYWAKTPNTTCAVPGCGAPISEPNNLCKEHRLPGLSVRVDGSTMVITAWYAEHGDEAGLILLNDWAPGAHFGGGAGFEGSLAAKHYQQKMIDFYMISDHVRHASRSRRCVATRRNLNDERAAILSGWPRRRRT